MQCLSAGFNTVMHHLAAILCDEEEWAIGRAVATASMHPSKQAKNMRAILAYAHVHSFPDGDYSWAPRIGIEVGCI